MSAELRDLLGRLLEKDPARRITLRDVRVHVWITRCENVPLPSFEMNCSELIEVTEEEVINSVRRVPKIETLVRLLPSGSHREIKCTLLYSIKHRREDGEVRIE